MTKILLVRHGHVEGISPERFRGRADLALTERSEHPGAHLERAYSEETARRLGIPIEYFPTRTREELTDAFNPMTAILLNISISSDTLSLLSSTQRITLPKWLVVGSQA